MTLVCAVFFFKQKTAYEMRISDWSSDVCSSDLFECYDIGHLYILAHFLDRGIVEPPLFVQSIFGLLGGIGAEEENLLHMRTIANRLFGDAYHWSIDRKSVV